MLPRVISNLPEETILVMVMLGPHEPTLAQMNNIMDIWVQHMLALEGSTYPNCKP